jgi:hypothetical protein
MRKRGKVVFFSDGLVVRHGSLEVENVDFLLFPRTLFLIIYLLE